MRVAVVGAGVVGMTTAFSVKTAFPDFEVKVFSDVFSPETTGDGSAGLWGPYLVGDTDPENVMRWTGRTHKWFETLWKSGQCRDAGIALIPILRVSSTLEGYLDSVWPKLVYGAYKLNEGELAKLNVEHKSNYKSGWHFLSYTAEPIYLLPWLMKRFASVGGKLEKRKILNLDDLVNEGYDLIINCTGLGARDLARDDTLKPIRGQVSRAKAPWAMQVYLVDDEDGRYIIPNIESVVLGGTHQVDDFDLTVRKEDTKFIREGCERMLPALKGSEEITQWVGLRPGRPTVRLECEKRRTPKGYEYTVIHNYGHGGAGITLSWGCAQDVVEMIKRMETTNLSSKL